MNSAVIPHLLCFYGIFLIVCGIASVLLIGLKAKTALASGGLSGALALLCSWLIINGTAAAVYAGIFLSLALFCVFAWRSAKTLFALFSLIRSASPDVNAKGIAFLIISLMAVVSMMTTALQIISL